MGLFRDRLRAAWDEVGAADEQMGQADQESDDVERCRLRSAADDRQLRAGANVYRALVGRQGR